MATFDIKYYEKYKTAILGMTSITDFVDALPSERFDGYKAIMLKLLEAIQQDMETLNKMLLQAKDGSDTSFINSELQLFAEKQEIISQKITDLEKPKENGIKENGISDINSDRKDLIFLKSPMGNTFLERDTKDFPEEYFPDVIDLIRKLREYDVTFNNAYHRKFINDDSLNGIFELKCHKVRLIYKHLDKDTILVIMALYKNQTAPTKEKESLVSRVGQSKAIISSIMEDLRDPEKKAELIEDHALIETVLIDKLESKRRGQR